MTMAAAQAGAWPGVNGPDDVLDRAAHFGGPAKRMYGDCGGGSSRRVRSNPDRPCGLLDPCASKGACTGLRGPLVQQCTGGYPVFRTRRLDRCLYDPHADRGEHRVELGGELGGELRIPVPDQELQADTVSGTHRSRRWRCWTSGCGGAAQPPPALAGAEFEDLTGAAFALVEHDVHVRVADGSERRCESLVGFPRAVETTASPSAVTQHSADRHPGVDRRTPATWCTRATNSSKCVGCG